MSVINTPAIFVKSAPTPLLRTLVLCDLVDSTALIQTLGDQHAAQLIRKHDRIARDILRSHGGLEIDKTDGFLLLFERPIQAIAFTLEYQRALKKLSDEVFVSISARIGVHVGEIVLWENTSADIAQGAKPIEVEGLIKAIVSRLMNLALPQQILISNVANELARRTQAELGHNSHTLQWKSHGRYRFKGVPEAMQVYEVGELGIAAFRTPPGNLKSIRELPWWRRPRTVAMGMAILLVTCAMPLYWINTAKPSITFTSRDWVVVGDLQNLTSEKLFDETLATAFRVGLEQSRYINVVSELQVRDTLKRMQRDPGATTIDRRIGAEIAMREGARALILPSIAEVGGHVKIDVEVVDPKTQITVYSEAADGKGSESVLPLLDQVSRGLREQLGEALTSIEADSQPLAKVATSDLDALRAYSLGLRAYSDHRWDEALQLYEHAVKLDPNFALAYMGMARVRLSSNDRQKAYENLQQALNLKQHLAPRDVLYLEAWHANFGKPKDMLEKWKLLFTLYPDYYAGYYNYALFAAFYKNKYEDAIEAVKGATSIHDPQRGAAYYLLGKLELATERYEQAFLDLEQAHSLHGDGLSLIYANAHAIMRQFDQAQRVLANPSLSGVASNDVYRYHNSISLPLDQGQWDVALQAASQAIKEAESVGPLFMRVYRAIELTLLSYSTPANVCSAQLKQFLKNEQSWLERQDDFEHQHAVFNVLLTAYLAARIGDTGLAQTALTMVTSQAQNSDFIATENLLLIAEAELARQSNNPEQAIQKLKPYLTGTELYQTHVVLMHAYRDTQRNEEALYEAQWLAQHRGRAYEEWNSFQALQAMNVIESDLAVLEIAEIELALNHKDAAARSLAEFRKIWLNGDLLPFLAPRVNRLETALSTH